MKVEKTNGELLAFIDVCKNLPLHVNATKLGSVLTKQCKVFNEALKPYEEKCEDLRIDHCSVDKDQNILRGEKNAYIFSKKAFRELNKAVKIELEKKITVEIFLKPEQLEICPIQFLDFFKTFLGIAEEETETKQESTTTSEATAN